MMRLFVVLGLVCMMFCSCTTEFDNSAEPQLVVEGWIENGQFPKVKLSYTIPLSSELEDLSVLSDYVEKWATVSVSDGDRTVFLVGHIDENEFPTYVYTTTEMRGEVGKTYHLKIETSRGHHAEATTTIPVPVKIESFEVEPTSEESGMIKLYAYVSPEGMATNDCYKVFTKTWGYDYGFRSAYMGVYNKSNLQNQRKIAINKGDVSFETSFNPYFQEGYVVTVKLAHIDDNSYLFWRDFEDMIMLSRNPLFPVTKNLHSNINGGLGYWFGYGISTYTIRFLSSGFMQF